MSPPSFTITTQGALTAKFTWAGASAQDMPPACATVTEFCNAQWSMYPHGGQGSLTGSGDNGLGSPYSQTPDVDGGATGTVYAVKDNPGASFSAKTISPTASVSGSNGAGGNEGISFQSAAYPVTITLTGTTLVGGAQEALTGQQITATLNFNGAPIKQVTSYNFSISGGSGLNPFKNWDSQAPGDGNPTQLIPLGTNDLSGTNPSGPIAFSFYDDHDQDLVTVKCTANIVFPDGTTASVTAQADTVAFFKPSVTQWGVNTGANGTTPGFFPASGEMLGNQSYGVYEIWDPIDISVPDNFTGGVGCIAQIAAPSRELERHPIAFGDTADPYYAVLRVNNPNGTYSYEPIGIGLDTGYPYQFGYYINANSGLVPAPGGPYTWEVSGPNVTGIGVSGDGPTQPNTVSLVVGDTEGSKWYQTSANDSFDTWVMYMPPGTNSIWVPLQKLHWGWAGSSSLVTLTGNWLATGGIGAPGSGSDTDNYPSWNSVFAIGANFGPLP